MKKLVLHIQSFARTNGLDNKQVMSDLLKYIIGYFNVEPRADSSWHYTKEQNEEFHTMMMEYVQLMQDELATKEWYDAWGDLFMELTPKGGSRGQFFTPVSLCDMMALANIDTDTEPTIHCGAFGKRVTISDPAAGSARNLLASHARFIHDNKPKPYLVAEDLDLDCCRMSAVNMIMHGCFGEVICHDTLSDPKGLVVGFVINETMYPFPTGIPSVRIKNDPQAFVSLRTPVIRQAIERQDKPNDKKEPVQLSIF